MRPMRGVKAEQLDSQPPGAEQVSPQTAQLSALWGDTTSLCMAGPPNSQSHTGSSPGQFSGMGHLDPSQNDEGDDAVSLTRI